MIQQFFDDDFCMLVFFITDDFIRNTIQELKGKIPLLSKSLNDDFHITTINETPLLTLYFQNMLYHFGSKEKPVNTLLELKFKELLISLLTSNENKLLARYFTTLSSNNLPPLPYIMEQNYCYNLSLEEFAKLCHRSLSSFKRDFQNHYSTTPGKWLLSKRLEHAAVLLLNEAVNVSQVAYESGFEDTSHFGRTFKDKFGKTPLSYRNQSLNSEE